MERVETLSLKRKTAMAICAFFSLFVLALSVMILNGGTAYAAPVQTYTAVAATYKSGQAAYAGYTTAAQLKERLTVVGTYDESGTQKTATLTADEYEIAIPGMTVENDTVIPKGTASVTVTSGDASVTVSVTDPTKLDGEIAVFVNTLSADAETLASAVTVKKGNTILLAELYTVAAGESFATDKTFTVTFLPTGDEQEVTIGDALTAVEVGVKANYTQENGYYKEPVSDDGVAYSAFVAGMTKEQYVPALDAVGVYGSVRVAFTVGGTTPDGKTVSVDLWNLPANRATITVSAGSVRGTLTVPVEDEKIVKVNAVYNGTKTLYPYDKLTLSDITVTLRYNNKRDGDVITNTSYYGVEGVLTPSGEEIGALLAGTQTTYSKKVLVRFGETPSGGVFQPDLTIAPAEILIEGINWVEPSSLGSFSGSLATQTVFQDINFSGLNIAFEFEDGEPVTVALDDIAEYCSVEYQTNKSGSYVNIGTDTITDGKVTERFKFDRSVTHFRITCKIGTLTKSQRYQAGEINLASHALPAFNTAEISYTDGCFKVIEGVEKTTVIDDETVDFMSVSVHDVVSGTESGISTGARYVSDESGDRIVFTRGGTFRVKVTLTDNECRNVWQWANAESMGAKADGNFVIYYDVTVLKADVTVTLQNYATAGAADRIYGTVGEKDVPTVAISGTTDALTVNKGEVGESEQNSHVYDFRYYGFTDEHGTEYTAENPSKVAPKNVGSYTLVAVTSATPQFNAGKSAPVSFEITPKELTAGNLTKTVTYTRGTKYEGSDLVKLGDDLVKTAGYNDTLDKVVEIDEAAIPTGGATHKGEYSIPITIISDNYKWAADAGATGAVATAKLIIRQRTLSFDVTGDGSWYTYGESGSVPTTANDFETKQYVDIETTYYSVEGSTETEVVLSAENPLSAWNAGDYKAVFSAKVKTSDDAELNALYAEEVAKGDYECASKTATFTVYPAKVATMDIRIPTNAIYKASAYDVIFGSWATVAGQLKNGDNIEDIFALTVAGTRQGAIASPVFGTDALGNKTLELTDADTYTIRLSFKADNKNYAYDNATNEGLRPDEEETFVISPRALQFIWKVTVGGVEKEYADGDLTYSGNVVAHPVAVAKIDGFTGVLPTVTAQQYDIYKGIDDTGEKITANDVIDAVAYYIAVDGFTCDDEYNYTLDGAGNAALAFEIKTLAQSALTLVVPTDLPDGVTATVSGNTATVTYKGVAWTFADFVETLNTNIYTVTVADGKSMKNVDTYTVYLALTGNYEWKSDVVTSELGDGTKVVVYTVQVEPFTVNLSFDTADGTDTTVVVYDGLDKAPVPRVTNGFAGDVFTFGLEFKAYNADKSALVGDTLARVVNAGYYKATVTALGNGNYVLPAGDENVSALFTVKKAAVALPTLPETVTGIFSGHTQEFVFGAASGGTWLGENDADIAATVTRTIPASWFMPLGASDKTFAVANAFAARTRTLTITDAGIYTFVFTLSDGAKANYYWDGMGGELDFAGSASAYIYDMGAGKTITMNRMEIFAPVLGERREQEQESATNIADLFTKPTEQGVTYTTSYGKYDGTDVAGDNPFASGMPERGEYYIQLKVLAANNPLNYVWVENPNDKVGSNSYVHAYASYTYGEDTDGVSIRLYFMITSSRLFFDYDMAGYVFGNNGVGGIDGLADLLTMKADAGHNYGDGGWDAYAPSVENADPQIKADSVKFYASGNADTVITDLENGLPWNVGEYTVKFTVDFRKDDAGQDIYQSKNFTLSFAVTPRAIKVAWGAEVDEKSAYKGDAYILTATVDDSVIPQRASGKIVAPDLEVIVANGSATAGLGGKPVNAGKYTLTVRIAGGTSNADNFMIVTDTSDPDYASYALTHEFEILPLIVSIVGNAVNNHMYGEKIPSGAGNGHLWTYAAGSEQFKNGDGQYISVSICVKNGEGASTSYTEVGAKPNVGTYYIRLAWADANAAYAKNYTVTFDGFDGTPGTRNPAVFVVGKRAVTVNIASASATSVYGTEMNDALLYREGVVYTITSDVKLADSAKNVFSLNVKVGDTDELAGQYAPVSGTYRLCFAASNENYAVTFTVDGAEETGGSVPYVITPAAIGMGGVTVTDYDDVYDTEWHALFTQVSGAPVLVNGAENDSTVVWQVAIANKGDTVPADWDSLVWTDYNAQTHGVKDFGTQYYFMKVTAENHAPAYYNAPITMNVTKAELTVSVNLTITFGEKSPAAYDGMNAYKTEMNDLYAKGGIYTVTGFAGDEKSKFNPTDYAVFGLSGTFTYTTGYAAGADVGTYGVTLNVSGLSATNYTFTAGTGVLTVEKLELQLAIDDQESVYYTDEMKALTFGVAFTQNSTYYPERKLTESDLTIAAYADVFTLTTAAYKDGKTEKEFTNDVGEYAIDFVVAESAKKNYSVSKTGNAIYEITPAALVRAEVSPYVSDYDEAEHALLTFTKEAATLDGTDSALVYEYYVSGNAVSESAALGIWDTLTGVVSDIPKAINAGTYYVYCRITAPNYAPICVRADSKIHQAQNGFTDDGVFNFANGNAAAWDSGTEFNPDDYAGAIGWTYGLYETTYHENGYNENGNQKVNEPVAKFTHKIDANGDADGEYALTAALFRRNESGWGTALHTVTLNGNTVQGMLNDIFAGNVAGVTFDAGTYRLHITMDGNANFVKIDADYIFSVAKATLTVQAENVTVRYGDAVPAFSGTYEKKPEVAGLKINSTAAGALRETADDVISVFGGGKLTFVTDYVTGSSATGYAGKDCYIRANGWDNENPYSYYSSANYELNFEETRFTVEKRAIAIAIADQETNYNLYETAENGTVSKVTPNTLTFTLTDGTFYEGDTDVRSETDDADWANAPADGNNKQNVFTLTTDALKKYNADLTADTADKGAYTIYAMFANADYRNNYDVTVTGNNTQAADEQSLIIGGAMNAGTFTVYPATVVIGVKSPENQIYSGTEKKAEAYIVGAEELALTFTYAYSKDGVAMGEGELPKDVGAYSVVVSAADENYKTQYTYSGFSITPATLTVKAVNAAYDGETVTDETVFVQYGTAFPADGAKREENGKVRFGGVKVLYSSAHVDADVLAELAENGEISGTPVYSTNYRVGNGTDTTQLRIDVKGIVAKNFAVTAATEFVGVGALKVTARQVTVTVKGAENGNTFATGTYVGDVALLQSNFNAKYGNNIAHFLFPEESDWKGSLTYANAADALKDLRVTLTIAATGIVHVNADGYRLSATAGNPNFAVTFKTKGSAQAGANWTGSASDGSDGNFAPLFEVEKATVTLTVKPVAQNTITYGDPTPSNFCTYESVGFVGDDASLVGALTYATDYVAWNTNVGTCEFWIDTKLELNDYTVVYKKLTVNVVARAIGADTADLVFTADSDYHGGKWGIAHNATISFKDTANTEYTVGENISIQALTYNTGASEGQTAGKAPTKAGEYTVTVALVGNNYVFDRSLFDSSRLVSISGDGKTCVLHYTVNKRVIDETAEHLRWQNTSFVYGADSLHTNTMETFISAVMDVHHFTFQPEGNGSEITLSHSSAVTSAENTYFYNASGQLCVNVRQAGVYTAAVALKPTAVGNYRLAIETNDYTTRYFYVTSSAANMTLTISGWTYGDDASEPVVTLFGNAAPAQGIEFSYAWIATVPTDIADYIAKADAITAADLTALLGSEYTFASSVTFNAGYYVVSAYYRGGTNAEGKPIPADRKYHVFRVTQRSVELPQANFTDNNGTYTAQQLALNITFDDRYLRFVYSGTTQSLSTGITLLATDAGTYTVSFYLRDTKNYVWDTADGTAATDAVPVVWTVAPANNNVVGMEAVTTEYGTTPVLAATATYTDSIFRYRFATSESAPDEDWRDTAPTQTGTYWVKAIATAPRNAYGAQNYAQASSTPVKYTVSKATLYVRATGTGVYGDVFDEGNLKTEVVAGLKNGELEKDVLRVGAGFAYIVPQILTAGEHDLLLATDADGNVLGMSADNYAVKLYEPYGKYTVRPRAITVKIGDTSSVFTAQPDLSGVTLTVTSAAGLAPDDAEKELKALLGVELLTNYVQYSPVGGYLITAKERADGSYTANANYTVTITPGAYTVTPLEIHAVLTAGGGTYGGEIIAAQVGEITSESDTADIAWVKNNLAKALNFTYAGVQNDGTPYSGIEVPTAAGNYTATVMGAGNNYVLTSTPFVTFTVDKKEIDASAISVASQVYTGMALTPKITDTVNESGVYTVGTGEFIKAGTHNVVLTLTDAHNTRWSTTGDPSATVPFVVNKAKNELTSAVSVLGWTYGNYDENANKPSATVKFGNAEDIVWLYARSKDGVYSQGVPVGIGVGTYWVRATLAAGDDYEAFVGEPVSFEITKAILSAPVLGLVSEGENKNDVFTGGDLAAAITGFNSALMKITYDRVSADGDNVTVFARNAGTYTVRFSLTDTANYKWTDGTADGEGIVTLTWTVARKKLDKPTENTRTFVVNGKVLTYIPEGFDASIMRIYGNQAGYGGTFTATVGLIDTENYEWADGTVEDITFTWKIVGVNAVFVAVMSTLGGLTAVAVCFAGAQLIRNKRKKRLAAEAIERRSAAAGGENV